MIHRAAVVQQIRLRLGQLRTMSYGEVRELPGHTTDHVRFGSQVFDFITYADKEPSSVRVVVQALPQEAGIIWSDAQAEGFRIHSTGEIEPVADRELFEFM